MFTQFVRLAACVLLATTTAACATVTRGVNEGWTVQSEPPSASVTTSNGFHCDETPCTFRMKHNASFDVTVSKPGYKSYHGHVTHQVSEDGGLGMAGNVIVGGLVGATVDVVSGAMMELTPNPLAVALEPVETAGSASASHLPAPTAAATVVGRF